MVYIVTNQPRGTTETLLANDVDGTVFDNRKGVDSDPFAGAIRPGDLVTEAFHKMACLPGVENGFVTGRNIRELDEGQRKFGFDGISLPFAGVDTGLHMYQRQNGELKFDSDFNELVTDQVRGFGWDKQKLMRLLGQYSSNDVWLTRDLETVDADSLKVQWTVRDPNRIDEFTAVVRDSVEHLCQRAAIVIGSVDWAKGQGFLDVMPLYRFDPSDPADRGVTGKVIALEYFRRRMNLPKDRVCYAGDSGNDYTALIEGYKGTLVENASQSVRDRVLDGAISKGTQDSLYMPRGPWGSGRFADSVCLRGVINGAIHHGFFEYDAIFSGDRTRIGA